MGVQNGIIKEYCYTVYGEFDEFRWIIAFAERNTGAICLRICLSCPLQQFSGRFFLPPSYNNYFICPQKEKLAEFRSGKCESQSTFPNTRDTFFESLVSLRLLNASWGIRGIRKCWIVMVKLVGVSSCINDMSFYVTEQLAKKLERTKEEKDSTPVRSYD